MITHLATSFLSQRSRFAFVAAVALVATTSALQKSDNLETSTGVEAVKLDVIANSDGGNLVEGEVGELLHSQAPLAISGVARGFHGEPLQNVTLKIWDGLSPVEGAGGVSLEVLNALLDGTTQELSALVSQSESRDSEGSILDAQSSQFRGSRMLLDAFPDSNFSRGAAKRQLSGQATTRSNGEFSIFANLDDVKTYWLEASCEGYESSPPIRVVRGSVGHVLVLRRIVKVSGELELDEGVSADQVEIRLYSASEKEDGNFLRASVRASNQFLFDQVAVGVYSVAVLPKGAPRRASGFNEAEAIFVPPHHAQFSLSTVNAHGRFELQSYRIADHLGAPIRDAKYRYIDEAGQPSAWYEGDGAGSISVLHNPGESRPFEVTALGFRISVGDSSATGDRIVLSPTIPAFLSVFLDSELEEGFHLVAELTPLASDGSPRDAASTHALSSSGTAVLDLDRLGRHELKLILEYEKGTSKYTIEVSASDPHYSSGQFFTVLDTQSAQSVLHIRSNCTPADIRRALELLSTLIR